MDSERHVFISDVHIGAFSEEENQRLENDLISLIHFCKEQQFSLYILGDLFDYWMEYPAKKFIPALGEKVLDAFEAYNKQVKKALFITGNHDNWTRGHFADRGFEVEENFRIQSINGKKFLLMHGDGIASDELNFPRKKTHRLLRNEYFVKLYQAVFPPSAGLKLMKWFSSQTRKKDIKDPVPLNKTAENLFEQLEIDYILCGHDHIPRQKKFSTGTFLNTGAFFKHRTVAIYNNETCSLVRWHSDSKKFLPFGNEIN